MTDKTHESGTDRIAQAIEEIECDIVINVQGDEPGIEPELIERVIECLQKNSDPDLIVSAATALRSSSDYSSPHVVKVVTDLKGRALYYSRAPIPFFQNKPAVDDVFAGDHLAARQHIGIYGYSGAFLRRLDTLAPGELAAVENLEQLNWLENGFAIELVTCNSPWSGIDTPEELERFAAAWDGPEYGTKG